MARSMEHDIIEGMSEGVLMANEKGKILYVNRAAEAIFERPKNDLLGKELYTIIFDYQESDDFSQAILDAIFEENVVKDRFVSFDTGEKTKILHMIVSYLKENDKRLGIIIVLSDVSELYHLRDAVAAMKKIEELNIKLNQRNELLSKTFGRYLSDEIVKQLIDTEHGLDLGGKKEHLTIMMSDLRGFTAMSEQMPANDLLTMLNHYLGEMTDVIQKHKGTIIEFIGDGIMAIFGAPHPIPNHTSEAVAAGIEMQMRMEEINQWNEERGYPILQMGIGINTGDVIVGNIGSEKRTKYGVTGSEVNLCGRVESYTIGGQVLVSEKTRREIEEELDEAGQFSVYPKGAKTPITIYHIEGIGAPYNLCCKEKPDEMTELAAPVSITYSMVIGKDVSEEVCHAELLEMGENGARMRVEIPVKQYDNVVLHIGGELYAKIMEVQDQMARIHFTAFPDQFKSFYNAVLNNQPLHH